MIPAGEVLKGLNFQFAFLTRGVLPSKRLLGMCRWMGSHFHNWDF